MARDIIRFIDVNTLQPNPFQPRSDVHDKKIEDLAESIAEYGVLEPLVVADTPAGFQIIAGERRWRASRKAGLEEVPALIKKTTPRGMLEMALVENVQRLDLNPIERAKALMQLMRDFGLTMEELAKKIGRSKPYISNTMKLLKLPDAIKDALVGDVISEGHARALISIPDQERMIEVYKKLLKKDLSVRQTEEEVRKTKRQIKREKDEKKGKKEHPTHQEDPRAQKWEKKFMSYIQAKAKIKLTRTQNVTRIKITLKGDPSETEQALRRVMKLTSGEEIKKD